MTDKQGYVYILTNPSFKDDWVKIGKSSRPVDVRSKELDNTAVPLPFNIYATLRTAKYEQIEKAIHKQLDLIAPDKRVRKGREFFNVQPNTALEIFKILAATLDDAVIEIYQENKVVDTINYSIESEKSVREIFCCKGVASCGEGYYLEETGEFILLKGAIICDAVTDSYRDKAARQKFIDEKTIIKKGNIETKEDIVFKSVSLAASLILGRSANGWITFINKDGKTLDAVYRKK